MKKITLALCFIGAMVSQSGFAKSCYVDRGQMYDQIGTYGSISTRGCPFNPYGWGITSVTVPVQTSDNTCQAICEYATGPGAEGIDCTWELGNWGDTLNCAN